MFRERLFATRHWTAEVGMTGSGSTHVRSWSKGDIGLRADDYPAISGKAKCLAIASIQAPWSAAFRS